MFPGEAFKRIDSAQADRENLASKHFGTLLVTLVQQVLLRRVSLTLGYQTAPDGKRKADHAGDYQAEIADRRAAGFHTIRSIPQPVPEFGA